MRFCTPADDSPHSTTPKINLQNTVEKFIKQYGDIYKQAAFKNVNIHLYCGREEGVGGVAIGWLLCW